MTTDRDHRPSYSYKGIGSVEFRSFSEKCDRSRLLRFGARRESRHFPKFVKRSLLGRPRGRCCRPAPFRLRPRGRCDPVAGGHAGKVPGNRFAVAGEEVFGDRAQSDAAFPDRGAMELLLPETYEQQRRALQTRRRPEFEHQAPLPEEMRAGRFPDGRRLMPRIKCGLAGDKVALHADDHGRRLRLLLHLAFEPLERETSRLAAIPFSPSSRSSPDPPQTENGRRPPYRDFRFCRAGRCSSRAMRAWGVGLKRLYCHLFGSAVERLT
jgi:hypothetical protein